MVNVLSSRIIAISRKDILFCFSRSIVNDILTCRPFRKLRNASKCLGEVNKTKISSTYRLRIVFKNKTRLGNNFRFKD